MPERRSLAIPQELLRELHAIRAESRELGRRERRLRQQILDLDAAGAAAEPGRFELRIQWSARPQLTVENLVDLLGHEEAQSLLGRLPDLLFALVYVSRRGPRLGDERVRG